MVNCLAESFQSRSGLCVTVRDLEPADTPLLVDLFDHLGPDSRYQRFNLPLVQPEREAVWDEAARMADVPSTRGRAFIALADLPGEPAAPVAGGRYLIVSPGVAEASIAVRDDCQRDGIGSALMIRIFEHARAHGVETIIANVQATNLAIWRLLRETGHPIVRRRSGETVELEVSLLPAPAAER